MGERIRRWYCERCDTDEEIRYQGGLDEMSISILIRDDHKVKSPFCGGGIDNIIQPSFEMSSE